jgi:hypothetical protein
MKTLSNYDIENSYCQYELSALHSELQYGIVPRDTHPNIEQPCWENIKCILFIDVGRPIREEMVRHYVSLL